VKDASASGPSGCSPSKLEPNKPLSRRQDYQGRPWGAAARYRLRQSKISAIRHVTLLLFYSTLGRKYESRRTV
jgi:hypothetical protein